MKEENQEISKEEISEVKFVINSYEDIFSDFDPRPFSQKGLSEDFLTSAQGAIFDKTSDKLNFVFLVPEKFRNIKDEIVIKERLKKHFKKHLAIMEKEKSKVMKKGFGFTLVGIVLMVIVTLLFFKFKKENVLVSFFTILLEPASWFLFWEGLHQIVFESKSESPNLNFYKKMSKADISFS